MSLNHDSSHENETVHYDEHGVMITDAHVRTQKKTYALSGSAFSRTRCSEGLEVDPEETARLRRRLLPWALAGALLLSGAAAFQFGDTVQAQYFLMDGRNLSALAGRGIAFGLAAVICGIALTGLLLCARVQRRYKLYHVYLNTRAGRREIASSRNEARITAIAAALDKAIARLSVASTEPPMSDSRSAHSQSPAGSFAGSSSQPAA